MSNGGSSVDGRGGGRLVDGRQRFATRRAEGKNGLGSLAHMTPLTDYKSVWRQGRELLAWGIVKRQKPPKGGLCAQEKMQLQNTLLALINNGDIYVRKLRVFQATDAELLKIVDRVVAMWAAESSLRNTPTSTRAVEILFTINGDHALFTIAGYTLAFNAENRHSFALLRGEQFKVPCPKRMHKKFVHELLRRGREGDEQAITLLKKAYPHIEPTEQGPESA